MRTKASTSLRRNPLGLPFVSAPASPSPISSGLWGGLAFCTDLCWVQQSTTLLHPAPWDSASLSSQQMTFTEVKVTQGLLTFPSISESHSVLTLAPLPSCLKDEDSGLFSAHKYAQIFLTKKWQLFACAASLSCPVSSFPFSINHYFYLLASYISIILSSLAFILPLYCKPLATDFYVKLVTHGFLTLWDHWPSP